MGVNLFLLIPESIPSNHWMQSNEPFQSEDGLKHFFKGLESFIEEIRLEQYDGYYDSQNLENFLADINILEDYYPFPAKRLLYRYIQKFEDWRKSVRIAAGDVFTIFGQNIDNHSFCEIARRTLAEPRSKFLLLNHSAHRLPSDVRILFAANAINIRSVSACEDLNTWFSEERVPERKFHIVEKHGENRQDIRLINGVEVSPLRCSREHAAFLLHTAIGLSTKELFNIDSVTGNYYLVFKYEGNIGENLYHGFHVPFDSADVPEKIKTLLKVKHNIP